MIEFEELKRIYEAVSKAISTGQEPTEGLMALRGYLGDLCADDGALLASPAGDDQEQSTGLPEEQIKYVLEELGPGLIRKMCRERSRDDQVGIFHLDQFNKINQ